MGARIRVFLTREQDKTLFNLISADVPQKVKDRAEVVVQLAQKLESDRSIKLSPDRLRRVLKKRGSYGSESGRVIKENKTL